MLRSGPALLVILAACGPSTIAVVDVTPVGVTDDPVTVVVNDATGALVSRDHLAGRLELDSRPGDMITIVYAGSAPSTYYGLEAGDELRVGWRAVATRLIGVSVPPATGVNDIERTAVTPDDLERAPNAQPLVIHTLDGATEIPLVAATDDGLRVHGVYGGRAIAIGSGPITLDQPLATHTVIAVDSAARPGDDLIGSGWMEIGDAFLRTPDWALTGNHQPVFPIGIADRELVELDVSIDPLRGGGEITLDASFEGEAPDQVDLGAIAISAPPIVRALSDGVHVSWSLDPGAGAYRITGSLVGDGGVNEWYFVAPPGAPSVLVPSLPPDLAPGALRGGTLETEASDALGDYHELFAPGGWTEGSGTHHWAVFRRSISTP